MASPELLAEIHPDKLLPSSDRVPERFELGTLPYELLAGTTAAVEFLAGLASDATDRRTRVLESMRAVEEHEDRLFARLLDGLSGVAGVTLHGSPSGVPRPCCSPWRATPRARCTSTSRGST